MTDNQIIKALERCPEISSVVDCKKCPLNKGKYGCVRFALDLINRQQAEIERLNTEISERNRLIEECQKVTQKTLDDIKENKKLMDECESNVDLIRAEAYKEFAERLKIRMGFCDLPNVVVRDHIDLLLTESEHANITKCGLCDNWLPTGHCKLIGPHIHKKYSDSCSSGIPREVKE